MRNDKWKIGVKDEMESRKKQTTTTEKKKPRKWRINLEYAVFRL